LHLTPPSFKNKFSKPVVKYDVEMGLHYLRRAALLGHGPSQLKLALAHRCGFLAGQKPVPRSGTIKGRRESVIEPDIVVDAPLAMHYLHLAARRGLPQADYEIANSLFWGGDEQLLRKYAKLAFMHARRAAKDGWGDAHALIGMAYESGIGVEKDNQAALAYYLKGASTGDKYAEMKAEGMKMRGFGWRAA
jgi:TPR repeat protein